MVEDIIDSEELLEEQIKELDASDSSSISEVFSSELISSIDEELIVEIINEINFEEFTEEESQEIMLALSNAPDDVKKIFEEEVNIFSNSNFNTYVPTGSSINVGQRRVLVAASATIMSAAAPAAARGRGK